MSATLDRKAANRMSALDKTRFWREFVNSRVIHHAVTPQAFVQGKWIDKVEDRDVFLLAVVQCWAMVRRPKAMPYVCHIDELLCK